MKGSSLEVVEVVVPVAIVMAKVEEEVVVPEGGLFRALVVDIHLDAEAITQKVEPLIKVAMGDQVEMLLQPMEHYLLFHKLVVQMD
jgi:hypothetical protein